MALEKVMQGWHRAAMLMYQAEKLPVFLAAYTFICNEMAHHLGVDAHHSLN